MTPHDFASALLTLGRECALVCGGSSRAEQAAVALLACHDRLPRAELWRRFSDLSRDGAPLEVVETFGPEASLGFTLEPRAYAGAEDERFNAALAFATGLWADLPVLVSELAPALRHRLWIGHGADACDVYLPVAGNTSADRILSALGIRARYTRSAVASRIADGRLLMFALTLKAEVPVSVTLYVRRGRPCVPPALSFYPEIALRRAYWDDPDTGGAVKVRMDGTLEAEAFYHYTSRYWSNDRDLLRTLGETFERCELPLAGAAILAGLIGLSEHALQRRMIALSSRPDGSHTRVKLYQSATAYVTHHRSVARESSQGERGRPRGSDQRIHAP